MILWNYPSQCPKCECKVVRPTWSQFRPTKPGYIAFKCAEENCQHRWEISALLTGPRGSGMPQTFISHVRLKNPDGSVRENRCEVRLVFSRDQDAAARVVLKDINDHTVEQVDFYSMERLITENVERSKD